jgi:signal transduction histidine kinase
MTSRHSELIDFRRAFWWLLGGVLLPSIALVAFGVVAVANERAAVEARLTEEYGGKLRVLGQTLLERLDAEAAAEVLRARSGLAQGPLVLRGLDLDEAEATRLGLRDAWLLAKVVEPAGRAGGLDRRLVATEQGGERKTWLLALRDGKVRALELDPSWLDKQLQQIAAPQPGGKEKATFRLLSLTDKSTLIDGLRRLLAEAAAGNRSSTVARLPLAAPLDGYLLTADLPASDSAAAEALRNRTLYIALLALLYTFIGVGFGLALRQLNRARDLSRLKTDFVANISHELRTPLTSVRLFAETLQSGRASTPEEVKECLDLLASEAERLSVLVEKLLDWSRLESGKRVLLREPSSVEALLRHVGEVFRAQQLGVGYSLTIEPGLPRVLADRDAMAQVIINLLHNAVKYTGDEKKIEVRARSFAKGKKVAIEVQDNGPGIRPQDKKRIFERFYRADDLLSRRTEGTGLGLAIAKRIVEWHHGTIEVDSREGEGSCFRVLLPMTALPLRAPGPQVAALPAAPVAPPAPVAPQEGKA